ncbi:hypothetical protein C6361_34175 [Plantactinospora sp. BC1]|uniref:hypothetical protein n=1 Tax=Plantactinospora sp. BC1 TaxID=2108470 RepID=UPI000D152730|nr:hypothetical protein [Plantactinospora sp. BC1]AVT33660.1 hypothetical protein C6361_34175 [Plantactinospora sp. BC1]
MTSLTFTQEDLDGLAAALDTLQLNQKQRTLLTAVLANAATSVALHTPPSFDSFAEQFDAAYSPGLAQFLVDPAGHIIRG